MGNLMHVSIWFRLCFYYTLLLNTLHLMGIGHIKWFYITHIQFAYFTTQNRLPSTAILCPMCNLTPWPLGNNNFIDILELTVLQQIQICKQKVGLWLNILLQ